MRELNAILIEINTPKRGESWPSNLKVLPIGEILGRDGRGWNFPLDDAMRVVERIQANGIDIVIDLNHGSYFGDPRAAGWLKSNTFEVRDDGIYADVEWTELGLNELKARHFRYLSPTIITERDRIIELESVGLVNIPNLRELPSLNNKKHGLEENFMSDRNHLETKVAELQERVLSLTQEKAELERKLNAASQERDDALRKLADKEAQLAQLEQKQQEMEINAILDKALQEGRIVPAQKDTLKAMGMRDMNSLKAFIEKSPTAFKNLNKDYGQERNFRDSSSGISITTEFDALAALNVEVDQERLEMHKKAMLMSTEMGIPYTQAISALMREV